jgi:hypothetical protein
MTAILIEGSVNQAIAPDRQPCEAPGGKSRHRAIQVMAAADASSTTMPDRRDDVRLAVFRNIE